MHTKRLYEIDALRFFAALIVVLFHFNIGTFHIDHIHLNDNFYLNNIFLKGNLGVRLFFMISGFVILMSAQATTALKFAKSRILRLYPAFIPLCIFTFLIGKLLDTAYTVTYKDLLVNVTLIGTILTYFKIQLVSGVYWTLVIEMQFYFIIFLLIYFKKINYIRAFLFIWLMVSILTYYGEIHFNYHNVWNKMRMLFITEHAFYFIAGCYFYLIKYQRKRFDIIMPAIAFVFAIMCFIDHLDNTLSIESACLIVSFFAIFYFIALRGFEITKWQTFYQTLGSLTYPLYLLHEEFGNLIIGFLLPFFDRSLILVSTILFIVYCTYLFNIYIEAPLTRLLKNLLYKKIIPDIPIPVIIDEALIIYPLLAPISQTIKK